MMLGEAQGRITLDVSDVMANSKAAQGALTGLDATAGKTGGGFETLKNGMLGLGTALIAPMALGLKGAVDLEQGIANINASLGGVDTSVLDELADMFLEVGSSSRYSATEVAAVSDELAKAGFTAEDMLGGMTAAVVELSQATGDGLVPATEGMIQAFSMWDESIVGVELAITDAAHAADVLTNASNQSAGGIQDIIGGLRNAGPALAAVGLSFEEAAGAIALFTNYGYSGDEIGTKLTRTLTFLAKPTEEAAAAMEQYGIAAFDAEGKFIGFPALFDQLQAGFEGVGEETRLAALKTIFGAEAFDLMNLAVETGGDPLREFTELMYESGTASEQSALRMNTLGAQFEELKEGVGAFLTSLVMGLVPGLRILVDTANTVIDVLSRIPDPIKTVIGAFAGLLAGVAAITRAMQAWQAINMFLGGAGAARAGLFGLGALGPIFIGLAAVIGIAAAAIKFNLFGIGDAVHAFAVQWQGMIQMQNPVSAFFSSLAAGLRSFNIPLFDRIAGGFDTVAEAIENFTDYSREIWRTRTTLNKLLTDLPKPLQAFGQGLGILVDTSRDFLEYWRRDGIMGILRAIPDEVGDLGAAFRMMTLGIQPFFQMLAVRFPRFADMFLTLRDAMRPLANTFFEIGLAMRALFQGDWQVMLDRIQDAGASFLAFGGLLQDAVISGLREVAGSVAGLVVDIGDWVLNVGVPAITGWIADHAGDIWAGLQAAVGWVWDGLVELGGWVLNTAVPAVTGWVADNAGSIWNALSTAAGWVWDGLVELGSWVITTAAPQVAGWMASASGNLWNALATAAGWIWSGVVDMPNWVLNTVAPTVAGWLTGIGEWLRTKIVEGLASFGITSTDLITVGTSIASALGEAVTLGLQSVADFGATVLTWLTEQMQGIDWNSLGNTIGTKLGEAIKLGIQGLAGLIGLGAYLLAELLLAIVDVDWSSLGSSIKAFLETALEAGFDFSTGFIQGLFTGLFDGISFDTITAKGAELIQSFTNGFEIAWPATQAWLADLGNKSLAAVGVMIDVLLGQGAALIQGFVNGFDLALPLVTAWLADLGNKAVAALPDLSEKLKQKGRDLIQGFWDGAKEIWDDFIGWLNGRDDDMDTISGEGEGGGGGAGASTLFGDWGPNVAGMMEQIRGAVDTGMETVRSTIQAKGIEWGTAMGTAIAALNSGGAAGLGAAVGGGAAGLLSGLASSVAAGMTAVTTTITTQSAQWGTAMATAAASLTTNATVAFTSVQTAAQSGMAAAGAAVANGANQMSVALLGRLAGMQAGALVAWGAIANAAQSGGAQMAAAAASAAATTAQVISAGMAMATAAVSSNASRWPAIISGYAGAMYSAGFGVGSAAGQGVAAGLYSTLGAVQSAASAIISTVAGAMTAAAMIASPSKLTAYFGEMMGMGLVVGLQNMQPRVAAASAAMMQVAQPFTPSTPASYGYGGTTVSAPVRVNAQIHTQGNLTDADKQALAREFAESLRDGIDIVYTSHGATS